MLDELGDVDKLCTDLGFSKGTNAGFFPDWYRGIQLPNGEQAIIKVFVRFADKGSACEYTIRITWDRQCLYNLARIRRTMLAADQMRTILTDIIRESAQAADIPALFPVLRDLQIKHSQEIE